MPDSSQPVGLLILLQIYLEPGPDLPVPEKTAFALSQNYKSCIELGRKCFQAFFTVDHTSDPTGLQRLPPYTLRTWPLVGCVLPLDPQANSINICLKWANQSAQATCR